MSFSKNLKEKASITWEACYNHSFVQELGRGTLDIDKFQFYLIQDYKYLLEYAKVFAIGALKSDNEKLMTNFTMGQYSILNNEMDLHRSYMKTFGIELSEAEKNKSSLFNSAYTSNMLNVGQQKGSVEIIAVVFPCGWTYYDFASRLKKDYAANIKDNPYKSWLDMYTSKEFLSSFMWFFDALDELVINKTKEEKERIEDIFISSLEFEYLFWDMAYKKQMSF